MFIVIVVDDNGFGVAIDSSFQRISLFTDTLIIFFDGIRNLSLKSFLATRFDHTSLAPLQHSTVYTLLLQFTVVVVLLL